MAVEGGGAVPRSIRALLAAGTFAGLTDGQLIERFVAREGEAADLAFAALVDQHGPMVLRVCRGVLRNEHDAEDAFQATFLILARKARSIRSRASLASWLFGVAYHVAVDAREASARRRLHESEAARASPQASDESAGADDDAAVIREELARLPARYREAVLLCSIEGLTQPQAAERLGLPLGTVQSRLARGRDRLRDRLARRGLAPASALAWTSADSARAAPPTALIESTWRAAVRFADGKTTDAISAAVAELARGGLKAMFVRQTRIIMLAAIAGIALVTGAGVLARQAGSPGDGPGANEGPVAVKVRVDEPRPQVKEEKPRPKEELGATEARRIALGVLAQAAAIDALPRFSYQGTKRHGIVDSMRAVDVSLDALDRAMTAPVLPKDWLGWYRLGFSWDETRFIYEMRPGEADLNYDYRFWTRTDAWARQEAKDGSAVNFARAGGHKEFWNHLLTFDFTYLRVAPHKYWWGRTVKPDHAMNLAPPEDFAWTSLGVEPSGGEACDVLDSAQRGQRLWVGRDSGRLRRVLSYYPRTFNEAKYRDFYASEAVRRIAGKEFETQQAYYDWCRNEATDEQTIQLAGAWSSLSSPVPDRDLKNVELNELAVFDDYREVAPGIWIPFRETRTNWLSSDVAKGKCEIMRTELRVEEVRTDRDLAGRYAELMPKEGDSVQDQRFRVAIDTKYSAATGDDEIRKRADVEYAKRLEGQEHLKRLVAPIDAMVGKPAPALPAEGWIGGPPPAVAGKPYLLHFWATWCGPCKNDLPRLKTLAEQGVVVVGMHPRGTPAEEVEKALRDDAFGGPTYLEPGTGDDAGSRRIAGYPSGVFPYYLVVDARGRVAGHGSLHEILTKFGAASLIARPDDPRDR